MGYIPSSSYVKHVRKLVDETDIGTDYYADKEDTVCYSYTIVLPLMKKRGFIGLFCA